MEKYPNITPEQERIFKALEAIALERFLEEYEDDRNFIGEDDFH